MTLLQTVYESLRLQLTGLSFMFMVLPVFLFLFYVVPGRARPAVLLVLSLGYYLLAEPGNLPVMLGAVAGNYAVLRLMERFDHDETARRICVGVAAVGNILVIIYCGTVAQVRMLPQVLGLQVYTLSALSAVIEAYRRETGYERSIIRFGLYCCFFPKLYAGPLVTCGDFTAQIGKGKLEVLPVLEGLGQFVEGAFKTAVIGSSLFALYRELQKLAAAEVTALSSWCTVFCVAFALYFMLDGFSDMAQGLGAAFGFRLPRNFYYPYQSRNVQDFFERFNITVHAFLRRTVYTALAGARNGPLADALNILVVGMLAGLWFGLRINYIAWGAFLALFVILERYVYPGLLKSIPTLFCRLGTLCVVLASFTIFLGDSLRGSVGLVRSMFDFGNLYNDQILYLISSNWLLLLISCFFATNATSLVVTKFRRNAPRLATAVLGAADFCILVLLLALTY